MRAAGADVAKVEAELASGGDPIPPDEAAVAEQAEDGDWRAMLPGEPEEPDPQLAFGVEAAPEPVEAPAAGEILDPEEARRRRDLAIKLVDRGADPEWKAAALWTVFHLCLTRPTFTPDDVWAVGLGKPREPRALGPVMLRASREGWCRKTGRVVESQIPTQHRNIIAEWESLIG